MQQIIDNIEAGIQSGLAKAKEARQKCDSEHAEHPYHLVGIRYATLASSEFIHADDTNIEKYLKSEDFNKFYFCPRCGEELDT